MIRLGLTGSIGMGKSTVANMFRDEDIPVWDADATVHRLYTEDEALKSALTAEFGEVVHAGKVDRARLSEALKRKVDGFARLNAIVHPAVTGDRAAFFEGHAQKGAWLCVADIPLLYETGAEARLDAVVVVSAPPEIQKQRVMARPGMTEQRFQQIVSQQMSDAEKRRRADFIIDTGTSLETTREAVRALIVKLRAGSGQITQA